MSLRRFAGAVVAAAVAVAGMSGLSLPADAATGDPATNVTASPNYWTNCSLQGPTSSACTDDVLAAINHARALEGVGPMVLPLGFNSMSPAEQTFVVSNLERVDRGLQPAAGMVGVLNSAAQTGANNQADPSLASWTIGPFNANRWGSNWAGDLNALAADYDWMYADGWGVNGSFNLDCTGPGAAGCWGHRHNILGSYGGEELITGVAWTAKPQWTSIAQIFVAGSGSYPAFTLAWSSVTSGAVGRTLPPGTSTPPTAGQDPASATIGTTSTVVAGHTAGVTGRLADATTGAAAAGVPVLLCHRTAVETTGSCVSRITDSTGTVRLSTKPLIRTEWWLAFTGSDALAAASSRASSINVRSAVTAKAAYTSRGWLISASFAPVRGQLVRLQRRTVAGWLTLVKTPLRSSAMAFRVGSGRYRVWVAPAKGLLDNSAYVAAR